MTTLKEAKAELIKGVIDGIVCPCCGRMARINKIAITGAMVRSLSWIAKESEKAVDGWVMVQENGPDWIKRSNSHAKLIHWGLLERRDNDDGSKLHSGIYRPTRSGVEFLEGRVKVRKLALVYNNIRLKLTGPMVSVTDCAGVKFHFRESL